MVRGQQTVGLAFWGWGRGGGGGVGGCGTSLRRIEHVLEAVAETVHRLRRKPERATLPVVSEIVIDRPLVTSPGGRWRQQDDKERQ